MHQMTTIAQRGQTWRAQIRREGHKAVTATFPTKAQAQAWARKIEAEMDARGVMEARGLANITLKERIDLLLRRDRRWAFFRRKQAIQA